MPVTVPLLVPTIVKPVHPQPEQSQNPAIEEERLTDLLSRLQLQDDGQLINHVMEKFNTLIERHSKMLTVSFNDHVFCLTLKPLHCHNLCHGRELKHGAYMCTLDT